MSYINEEKTVTINVNFKGQIITGVHTISYYKESSLDMAELEYDLEEYTPEIPEDDQELLSEIISEYIHVRFARGLNNIINNQVIDLDVRNGVLI